MNDDENFTSSTGPSTGTSMSSAGLTTPGSYRKERGAIAAQACDTCRSRKQRCDEQRPRCGTCQKFKLDCNYREPQPTKKDRTMMEVLDRIKSLEDKIDALNLRASFPPATYAPIPTLATNTAPLSMSPDTVDASSFPPAGLHGTDPLHSASASDDHYMYVSSTHQMMGWPAMQQLLESVKDKIPGLNPAMIPLEGSAIILGTHEQYRRMPLSTDGCEGQIKTIGLSSVHSPGGMPLTIPTLTWETMQRLSRAYFDNLNFIFPLVDRQAFASEAMSSVVHGGFTESMASTIALLVFALGELVIAGSQGIPIRVYSGRQSGVKGGTAREPPGLALFNEARKRMGFNLTDCSLENVQVFSLASLYYGACGHNKEQWRMLTSGSLALEALIASKPSELSSPKGDLIRRAFWHCMMMETCITLELGLPTNGLDKFEQLVGLPDFSSCLAQEDYIGNQSTHFQEHFASQIVLRRLTIAFHTTLSQRATSEVIKQLAHQLDQWRGMLPLPLRWEEGSPGAFPTPNPGQDVYHPSGFAIQPVSPVTIEPTPAPSPSTQYGSVTGQQHQTSSPQPPLMFTTDLDAPPAPFPFAYDIQVALMRTRYYYAKYLLHRPFLHRALHSPECMTSDDAAGAAACLRAALKWPVTMSPTCTRKRLIPCLFFWTQNVLGVLLVLHLASTNPMLQRIVRGGLCGETWAMDASETVGLYMDWLRDLKEADPAARFGWDVVCAVYGLESD